MLTNHVCHFSGLKYLNYISLYKLSEKILWISLTKPQRNFNFLFFFLLSLSFLIFLLLKTILYSHIVQFKSNHIIHFNSYLLLHLWSYCVASQIGVIFLLKIIGFLSWSPFNCVLLNIILNLQNQFTWAVFIMLIKKFLQLILFSFTFLFWLVLSFLGFHILLIFFLLTILIKILYTLRKIREFVHLQEFLNPFSPFVEHRDLDVMLFGLINFLLQLCMVKFEGVLMINLQEFKSSSLFV
jgi:hypothetical protein